MIPRLQDGVLPIDFRDAYERVDIPSQARAAQQRCGNAADDDRRDLRGLGPSEYSGEGLKQRWRKLTRGHRPAESSPTAHGRPLPTARARDRETVRPKP